MRPTHDGVLDLILAHPHMTLRELSTVTGYSISWLSQMTRSDCFRAEYERRREGFESEVMMEIGERLTALSHLAIDRMEEKLQTTNDLDFIEDAFDKVLHRAGYAPNAKAAGTAPGLIQQNNVFMLSKDELSEMRDVVLNGSRVQPMVALVDKEDSGTE